MSIYSIQQIRELISPIATSYGVERMTLFGSYARGEATETSDVDFCVECGNIKDLFTLSGFVIDLEEVLKKKVDVVPKDKPRNELHRSILEKINREEVYVYG